MYKILVQTLATLAITVFLVGCGGDNPTGQSSPTPTAMSDPVAQELVVYTPEGGRFVFNGIESLMKANGFSYDIRIMEGVTTELTIKGLQEGAFDLIFLHRLPRPEEEIEFFELLQVNVAIFTHPATSVDNLTTEQIAAIFSGEITNWSEVGGHDQEIIVFILPEFDSNTDALRSVALGEKPFVETAQQFPDETSVLLSATGIPGGIGYVTWATKKYLELVDPDRKNHEFHAVSIDGMAIGDPDYPMTVVIGFGYLPERADFLEPLLGWMAEFLDSPQGNVLLQLFDVSTTVEE